ncbi:hypothetical protein RchiOBHm_Chr6g0276611 [Rosa chinensis]|uniref:Uncharacterized protein n=1 Tax=Rosa chinensis TaxID=74649 RepID=A0A2P6PSA4_ROSCH|nr:hypothetical protein RchiOBHm_Chr6g0276611 [Rosa chinensis]
MTFRMKLGSSISLWRRSLDSEFCINRSTHYLILHSPSRTYIGPLELNWMWLLLET